MKKGWLNSPSNYIDLGVYTFPLFVAGIINFKHMLKWPLLLGTVLFLPLLITLVSGLRDYKKYKENISKITQLASKLNLTLSYFQPDKLPYLTPPLYDFWIKAKGIYKRKVINVMMLQNNPIKRITNHYGIGQSGIRIIIQPGTSKTTSFFLELKSLKIKDSYWGTELEIPKKREIESKINSYESELHSSRGGVMNFDTTNCELAVNF